MGVLQVEVREGGIETHLKNIMMENIHTLVKEIDIWDAQKVPNKMDPKKPTPRHIIIKMPNVKDNKRILKAAKDKQLFTYKELP